MAGTERFDREASTWDLKAQRVALAHGVAQAIRHRVPLTRAMDVLDFGCGTGLVTFAVGAEVGTITGADASSGMLEALKEKAEAQAFPVRLIALGEPGEALGGPYHLIVSSMTLHHIAEVPELFGRFFRELLPGGQVALADLDAEDGTFHEDPTGVEHAGFARERIQAWLAEAGFLDINLETATVVRKAERAYPVFLATARKP